MSPSDSDEAVFAQIAGERRLLAETLSQLTHDQWQTPSLCGAWSVRDVAAHLVVPLVVPLWRFGATLVRARGSFDRANELATQRVVENHGDRLAELLVEHADHRFTPPGHGPLAPLSDIVVHGHDIRRPLGLAYDLPDARQVLVLDFIADSAGKAPFPALLSPYRWEATDLDWTHGDGPLVAGPAASIMLLMTGRSDALADVAGDGVEQLTTSMATTA
ncbi:maleylpyruvate isomerase family mycothiol-dependent enzyme [Aeromicrobium alkaliterrae]|uniref:Maleylpyruvate isomerase family mycothiol-dependent enzyme n=1 Tax=Aeromicrobium alkaliterrae TaxID=302168 RepID=A0ABN2JK15_9ACTN